MPALQLHYFPTHINSPNVRKNIRPFATAGVASTTCRFGTGSFDRPSSLYASPVAAKQTTSPVLLMLYAFPSTQTGDAKYVLLLTLCSQCFLPVAASAHV